MKEFFKKVGGGFLASLAAAVLMTAVIAVLPTDIKRELTTKSVRALTVPPTLSPRQFPTEQLHYARFTVNFNDCVLVSNTCSVKKVALPYNAWLVSFSQQIITSFNSATTDTVAFGTASGGAQIVAAQSVHGAAGDATALTLVHAGIASTGNGIAQTGANGGFDLWAVYAQTGAAPTAGQAVFLLQFAAANDGSCAYVPLGATAGAC